MIGLEIRRWGSNFHNKGNYETYRPPTHEHNNKKVSTNLRSDTLKSEILTRHNLIGADYGARQNYYVQASVSTLYYTLLARLMRGMYGRYRTRIFHIPKLTTIDANIVCDVILAVYVSEVSISTLASTNTATPEDTVTGSYTCKIIKEHPAKSPEGGLGK